MSTIEVNTINPQSGNDVTIGGSSKNVKFASGTTVDFSTNTPTLTLGAAMKNSPVFSAVLTGGLQSISSDTTTKVSLNSVLVDTDSGWDSSNYRWTVPSGKGGNYFIGAVLEGYSGSNNISKFRIQIKVNGSVVHEMQQETGAQRHLGYSLPVIKALSASDYVELFGFITGTSPNFRGDVTTCSLSIAKMIT